MRLTNRIVQVVGFGSRSTNRFVVGTVLPKPYGYCVVLADVTRDIGFLTRTLRTLRTRGCAKDYAKGCAHDKALKDKAAQDKAAQDTAVRQGQAKAYAAVANSVRAFDKTVFATGDIGELVGLVGLVGFKRLAANLGAQRHICNGLVGRDSAVRACELDLNQAVRSAFARASQGFCDGCSCNDDYNCKGFGDACSCGEGCSCNGKHNYSHGCSSSRTLSAFRDVVVSPISPPARSVCVSCNCNCAGCSTNGRRSAACPEESLHSVYMAPQAKRYAVIADPQQLHVMLFYVYVLLGGGEATSVEWDWRSPKKTKPRPEVQPEVQPEVKPQVQPQVQPELKSELKSEVQPTTHAKDAEGSPNNISDLLQQHSVRDARVTIRVHSTHAAAAQLSNEWARFRSGCRVSSRVSSTSTSTCNEPPPFDHAAKHLVQDLVTKTFKGRIQVCADDAGTSVVVKMPVRALLSMRP